MGRERRNKVEKPFQHNKRDQGETKDMAEVKKLDGEGVRPNDLKEMVWPELAPVSIRQRHDYYSMFMTCQKGP